jgi:hypothetical protein
MGRCHPGASLGGAKKAPAGETSLTLCSAPIQSPFNRRVPYYAASLAVAASFALLVYVSCWLKTHYHDAFACALLQQLA